MANKTELESLVHQIKKNAKQVAINKVDEVRVMQTMLNDKEYTMGVYDRSIGYIGQKSPHDEAVKFVKGIISGTTGLDTRDSQHLAENYEFTKKDANFLLSNMRDFLNVYTSTGRKINIMQTADTEACLYKKDIKSSKKVVPNKESKDGNSVKTVITNPYTKLVSASKCPKYRMED